MVPQRRGAVEFSRLPGTCFENVPAGHRGSAPGCSDARPQRAGSVTRTDATVIAHHGPADLPVAAAQYHAETSVH